MDVMILRLTCLQGGGQGMLLRVVIVKASLDKNLEIKEVNALL